MASFPIWRSVPDDPTKLGGSSSLLGGLALAWQGHGGLEMLDGTRPVPTGASLSATGDRRALKFAAGAGSASNLSFGPHVPSADLAQGPCTLAFYLAIAGADASNAYVASRNPGGLGTGGWGIRGAGTSMYIDFYTSGVRVEGGFPGIRFNGTPDTMVVRYDGGLLAAGIRCSFNGRAAPQSGGSINGSGTALSDAAAPLYLGAHRVAGFVDNSFAGDIMSALFCKGREWTDEEVTAFAEEPYRAFQPAGAKVFSFGLASAFTAMAATIPIGVGVSGTATQPLRATVPIGVGVSGTLTNGTPVVALSAEIDITVDVSARATKPLSAEIPIVVRVFGTLTGGTEVLAKPGGLGRENFGDPFGAGGPISVVRALAVDGRTVRVVFDEAPIFRTPAGVDDALNPANFAFEIASGDATTPVATVVSPVLVGGPARGVGNGGQADERGVDVAVDRPLVAGISYRVRVQNVGSALGGALGAPTTADFPGVVLLRAAATAARARPTTNVDVKNDVARGSWVADDSGDLAPEDARSGYKKRVIRRLTTPKNAFAFLKGYGLGQALKGPATSSQMAGIKVDAEQQIGMEPETAKVSVDASMDARGVLTYVVKARTRQGAFVETGVQVSPDGSFALLPST